MQTRVSLADLIDADVPLRPGEAVAIVREICRQFSDNRFRGIPHASVIRLTEAGGILVEGPVNTGQPPVSAAASLLADLLPGFELQGGFKVPGGLRLVLARALGTLDLPPFQGVDELSAALERFAAPDAVHCARDLFRAYVSRRTAASFRETSREITISDVRRARRATGLSLEDVAQVASVPAARLRELEWGYVRNWRADQGGRDEVLRYARAAGLDEEIVMTVAWPLIENDGLLVVAPDVAPAAATTRALVPAAPRQIAPVMKWPAAAAPSRLARHRSFAAASVLALIAAAAFVSIWRVADLGSAVQPSPRPPIARVDPVLAPAVAPPVPMAEARPATLVTPVVRRARPPARAQPRPAASRRTARQSFFKKELLRIVIR